MIIIKTDGITALELLFNAAKIASWWESAQAFDAFACSKEDLAALFASSVHCVHSAKKDSNCKRR